MEISGGPRRTLHAMSVAVRKALVVDDEPTVRETVAAFLSVHGFQVVTAVSGEQALEVFAAEAPDVVIVDLKMPGLNGMEVLRRIKATAPEVPVILVSGYGEIRLAVEAMRLGAFDFMAKPFQAEDLIGTVSRACERAELLGEVEALRRRVEGGIALTDLMGRGPRSRSPTTSSWKRVSVQQSRAPGPAGPHVRVLQEPRARNRRSTRPTSSSARTPPTRASTTRTTSKGWCSSSATRISSSAGSTPI